MNLGKFVVQKNFISKLYLNQIITTGLIIVSFFLACVGSGWGGDFKIWFLKISIHNLKNLEISLWLLLFSKVITLYYLSREKKKDIYRTKKISPVFNYFGCFLVIIALVILYRKTIGNYFIADDCLILQDVKKGFYNSVLVMPKVAWRFRTVRPMAFLTWFLDYKIFSIHPLGWYLTNLFLHAISMIIVILLTRKITDDMLIAIIVGAFFALSPLHHEVINWIAARADLLCGLFYLIAVLTYLTYRKKHDTLFLCISLLAFTLALLSKESAVSLPLIIVACELLLSKDIKSGLKKNAHVFLYYGAVLGLYLVMRFFVYGTISTGASLGGASKILLENIPEYIKGAFLGVFVPMFWPINWFSVDYFRLSIVHYISFLNALLICLLIIFNIKKFTRDRVMLFLVLFIICGEAVFLNNWEIGKSLHASRYYYGISFAIYLFIVYLGLVRNRTLSEKRLNTLALIIIFCCNIIFVSVNNLAWEHAGKIPLKVIQETKNMYPEFKTTQGVLYYYGLPKYFAGIVVYSWEPEVITEQLSHFYKFVPRSMVIRHSGIMLDLNKLDYEKDIVFQWNEKQEKLSDVTLELKEALVQRKSGFTRFNKILSGISDIGSWERNEQVIEIETGKHFKVAGKDGFFFSNVSDIPARELPFLTFRIKVTPQSKKYYSGAYSGKLYWRTDKYKEFSEERFVEFWLSPEEDYKTYYIYFISPEEVLGKENIIQLKFMPAYFPSDIYFEFIKMGSGADIKNERPAILWVN